MEADNLHYHHIRKYGNTQYRNPRQCFYLTQGKMVVTEILKWDHKKGKLCFLLFYR